MFNLHVRSGGKTSFAKCVSPPSSSWSLSAPLLRTPISTRFVVVVVVVVVVILVPDFTRIVIVVVVVVVFISMIFAHLQKKREKERRRELERQRSYYRPRYSPRYLVRFPNPLRKAVGEPDYKVSNRKYSFSSLCLYFSSKSLSLTQCILTFYNL